MEWDRIGWADVVASKFKPQNTAVGVRREGRMEEDGKTWRGSLQCYRVVSCRVVSSTLSWLAGWLAGCSCLVPLS